MSNADAAWYRMDRPTNRMIITSVLTFDERQDAGALRTLLQRRLVEPFPRFRQVVGTDATGRLRWEDAADFDVAVHVHRRALPAPGDRAALQELVGDLMSSGLDPLEPLWDVHLVEGYGAGCAVVVRMHHCIADGIALARVLLSLTDGAGAAAGAGVATHAPSHRGPASALLHESLHTALHPRHAVELAHEAVRDVVAMVEMLGAPSDPQTILKDKDHGIAQRAAWTPRLPLAEVKELAHVTGTTVNDVLMAALAGALARYLAEHGDDDGEAGELHATVPFNLRPLEEPLPHDLGNHFGLVLVGLPLGDLEPRERLDAVHRRMQEIKRSRQPAMSYATLVVAGAGPPIAERALIDFMTTKSTAVVTNVPGPRAPVLLAGVPIRDVLVWAPCSGSIGMSVSMFSYREAVTIGFMTHAALVPDPGALARATVTELGALRRSARDR